MSSGERSVSASLAPRHGRGLDEWTMILQRIGSTARGTARPYGTRQSVQRPRTVRDPAVRESSVLTARQPEPRPRVVFGSPGATIVCRVRLPRWSPISLSGWVDSWTCTGSTSITAGSPSPTSICERSGRICATSTQDRPDVVVAVALAAVEFVNQYGEELFPQTPLLSVATTDRPSKIRHERVFGYRLERFPEASRSNCNLDQTGLRGHRRFGIRSPGTVGSPAAVH